MAVMCISLDEAGVRQAGIWSETVAIDGQMARLHRQRGHRPVHSQVTSLRNIDSGDFLWRSFSDGPGHSFSADIGAERITAPGADSLGVVEVGRYEIGGQNDSGGENRTGQAPATSFVEAGFERMAGMGGEQHLAKIEAD